MHGASGRAAVDHDGNESVPSDSADALLYSLSLDVAFPVTDQPTAALSGRGSHEGTTVQVANSIALEATLSFLGLGLPVSEPSLGMLIANGFQYMLSGRYWISIYPGIALIALIVVINLVGDQVRDQLNPRLRR